jgi:poly-beta-1,6-N-acetyl-D-glucosamine synthase
MRGTWQVVSIYMKKLHAVAKIRRPLLPWVMGACYTADIWLIPLVNFLFLGMVRIHAEHRAQYWAPCPGAHYDHHAVAIYVVVQRDVFRLIPLAALMDLYLAYFVNAAWAIAAVDEIRGTRMKWH